MEVAQQTCLGAALDYRQRGWAVIDLDVGSKSPGRPGWQHERFDEGALRERLSGGPRNVSILFGEPSGGLVDVDLDSAEARSLADEFLPPTASVFGRPGSPGSHRLYVVEPAPDYEMFSDPEGDDKDRATLVEIRSGGQHTIVPPSTHPSGEIIAWEQDGQPAHLDTDELRVAVRNLAAAALLARHWNHPGQRNDQTLALLGGLISGGWDEGKAAGFVEIVARAAGDEEWSDRGKGADTTAGKQADEEPTTGWPTLAELMGEKVVERVRKWLGMTAERGAGKKQQKPSQADLMVELAQVAYLFHDPDQEAFATIPVENHKETHRLSTKGFKNWLKYRFFSHYGKVPGSQAVQDAVGALEGKAFFAGPERETHVRVAGLGGSVYLDLCNGEWEVVEVTPEGWSIVPGEEAPVRFRRSKGMAPLPYPAAGGDLSGLRRLLNLPEDQEGAWRLIVAWLVAALHSSGPYPVLILQGEQGSAKSTAQGILRAVVDPSTTPLRSAPREERDLVIAADNSWVVSFDNLSGLSTWLSDALCRLSTGGGLSTRQLYTDREEILFEAKRPLIMNGIADVASRPDLLDRSLVVELPVIPEAARRTEREIWDEFAAQRPAMLGALLDAVSVAMGRLPETHLEKLPRMAEFAEWVTAAEGALGWEPGSFMAAYEEGREEAVAGALEGDPVAGAVLSFMEEREEWIGKSAELHEKLASEIDEKVERSKSWPKTASHLSGRLKRLAPALRAEGLDYEDWREPGGGRQRKKRLSWRHEAHKGGRDGGGTAPKDPGTPPQSTPGEERPGHAPRHDARHAQDGQSGTARDGATHPYSADSTSADNVPVDTAQGQAGSSHGGPPREKLPGMALSPAEDDQSGGAEERPGASLPSHTAGESPVRRKHFRLLATPDDVLTLVEEIEAAEVVALDLETTGLDPRRDQIRLLSLATERGAWVLDVSMADPAPVLEVLKGNTLVIHNAAFDLAFLREVGYEHEGEVMDTLLLSQLLYAGANVEPLRSGRTSHALGDVCLRELGTALDKEHQTSDWAGEFSPEMVEYAARDAEVLIAVHCKLIAKIEKAKLSRTLEIEQRAQRGILWMARTGLPFDEVRWLELAEEAKEEAGRLNERLQELAPPHPNGKEWNWNSPQQVKQALSLLGLTVENTRDETLARLDHPFVRLLREYRKKNGIVTRHGKKWLYSKDGAERAMGGRIYPSWKQIGAATGRMACAEPNLQAIPHGSGHHSCVRAPEGRALVKADYSQIELRLAAKMWDEPAMLETFREGGDVHTTTAKSITGKEKVTKAERKLAKAVNFGLIFGQGAEGLKDYARNNYGVEMTLDEAGAYRTRFFQTYRGIARWHTMDDARLSRGEFATRTLAGRRRQDVRSYTEHLNAPVQGTAADGMKVALALLWERRDECPGAVPILAVHDEIVVECDEGEAEKVEAWLKEAMVDGMDDVVNADEPRVPIEVEASVSQTWGD